MKNLLIFSTLLLLGVSACQTDPTSSLKPLNLLQHGVPITIMAPDSAKVRTMDLLVQKDITVKGDDGYNLQIFASDASTTDLERILSGLKTEVKSNPYFTRMVSEEDLNGFIYETKLDSTNTSYGFQLVRVMGDREYIFQNALVGTFTEEEVKTMYAAVKEQKK